MSGWTTKKLGEVCTFRRGLTYSKGDEVEHSSKVVLRANNISLEKNQLCFDELKFIRDDFEIPDDKYLEKDCLLICTASGSKAHLGKVAYIDKEYDFAFGGFMGLIVPDVSLVFSRYFYYVLTAENYRQFIQRLTDGANINNLKFSQLAEFDIPIPPLAEQKRIVANIDAAFEKIDRLKANAEKNLANAKELFQSALDEAMRPKRGWVEKRLGEVYDVRDGTHDSPKYVAEGWPLVTSKNLRYGRVVLDEVKLISKSDYDAINARSKVDVGDVLMAMIGTIGNPVVVTEPPEYAIKNIALFKLREGQNSQFLRYLLLSTRVTAKMANEASGSNQHFVGLKYLRNFIADFPPLDEQRQIVSRLDVLSQKIETLQQNYARQIADCAEMRQAILREAFEGRL